MALALSLGAMGAGRCTRESVDALAANGSDGEATCPVYSGVRADDLSRRDAP